MHEGLPVYGVADGVRQRIQVAADQVIGQIGVVESTM